MENFDWFFILVRIIVATLILTFVLVVMGFLTYFERKVAAHMQQRQGPNRTGPIGLLQWVADAIKLMAKEDVFPGGVDKWVFGIAPMVSMFTATAAYAFIPFGESVQIGDATVPLYIADTPIGIIALLALSSLGVYGIIMGSWGSNNKYSILGGLRSGAQVVSYEIIMGISLVGVMILTQSFNLNDMARAQGGSDVGILNMPGTPGIWFILMQPIGFIMYTIGAFAETNRAPFDLPEAESELVSGYHVEYSGMRFGAFFLAEYINMITVSAIAAYCFLGGWQPILPIDIPGLGPIWFILKMAAFIFLYYWVRWTVPRFRYDQLMGLCWKVFLPIVLINILITSISRAFIPHDEPQFSWIGDNVNLASPWLIFMAVQLVWFAVVMWWVSRASARSWFGRSDRPVNTTGDRILNPATSSGEAPRRIEMRQGL